MDVYELTQLPDDNVGFTKAQRAAYRDAHSQKIWVNADQVGAILPRSSYTTLVISGKYVHVLEDAETVSRILRLFVRRDRR